MSVFFFVLLFCSGVSNEKKFVDLFHVNVSPLCQVRYNKKKHGKYFNETLNYRDINEYRNSNVMFVL